MRVCVDGGWGASQFSSRAFDVPGDGGEENGREDGEAPHCGLGV